MLHSTFYMLHSTFYILYSTFYILHSLFYIIHSTSYIIIIQVYFDCISLCRTVICYIIIKQGTIALISKLYCFRSRNQRCFCGCFLKKRVQNQQYRHTKQNKSGIYAFIQGEENDWTKCKVCSLNRTKFNFQTYYFLSSNIFTNCI